MSFRSSVVAAICVALCSVALVAGDYQLPATVKTCKRDSEDFSSCLRLAIQEAWPTFIPGIPELDMPLLDPYYVPSHNLEYKNGQAYGKISASDIRTYGLAKARFLSVKPEMSDNFFQLEVDTELPKILIECDYKAEGYLGSFKAAGKGFANVSMEDIRAVWDISGHITDDRWVVEHFIVTPTIGSMKIWFSDLFNGNEEMNRAALSLANEYWPLAFRVIQPKLIESFDPFLTELANRFFSKIPFSTVFP